MKDYNLENRKLVIGGIATVIVVIYLAIVHDSASER